MLTLINVGDRAAAVARKDSSVLPYLCTRGCHVLMLSYDLYLDACSVSSTPERPITGRGPVWCPDRESHLRPKISNRMLTAVLYSRSQTVFEVQEIHKKHAVTAWFHSIRTSTASRGTGLTETG